MNSEGNRASVSVRMSSRNVNVASFPGQYTSSKMPHVVPTSNGPPVHEYSGYAARAAREWPGISISGTTLMNRSAA